MKNVIRFLTDVSAITCLSVANTATKEAISTSLFNYREGFSPCYDKLSSLVDLVESTGLQLGEIQGILLLNIFFASEKEGTFTETRAILYVLFAPRLCRHIGDITIVRGIIYTLDH